MQLFKLSAVKLLCVSEGLESPREVLLLFLLRQQCILLLYGIHVSDHGVLVVNCFVSCSV